MFLRACNDFFVFRLMVFMFFTRGFFRHLVSLQGISGREPRKKRLGDVIERVSCTLMI